MQEELIKLFYNIISSMIGAAIGGVISLKIAKMTIVMNKNSDLEKEIKPFLLRLQEQCYIINKIYNEFYGIKQNRMSEDVWKDNVIKIIKDESNSLRNIKCIWKQSAVPLYTYYAEQHSDINAYEMIRKLVDIFSDLYSIQNNLDCCLENDILLTNIDKNYNEIVKTVEGIYDEKLKKRLLSVFKERKL